MGYNSIFYLERSEGGDVNRPSQVRKAKKKGATKILDSDKRDTIEFRSWLYASTRAQRRSRKETTSNEAKNLQFDGRDLASIY